MKEIIVVLLYLIVSIEIFTTNTYAAPDQPSNVSVETEGDTVMDTGTGTILYSKNTHIPYFPASITGILTALVIIENCDLNETVTFPHSAVCSIRSNSSSAGLDVGDTLNVRDCLYAMLLKSVNGVANALAERVADATGDFAVLMDQEATFLGCQGSSFADPSGLNNPDHYTSVYDMALTGQATLRNRTFVDIGSTLCYGLLVTKRNPDGTRVYPGHKMIKKNSTEYYPDAFGGKTGYTPLADSTLVILAKRNDMTLISIILNGHQTHCSDTRKLLDFGFQNLQSVVASDYDNTYTSIGSDMTIAGLSAFNLSGLMLDKTNRVTLLKNTDFSSVTSSVTYDLSDVDLADAVTRIQYQLGDRAVGAAYLEFKASDISGPAIPTAALADIADITLGSTTVLEPEPVKKEPIKIPPIVQTVLVVIVALALLITIIIMVKGYLERREASERSQRHGKRLQRLQEIGYSLVGFNLLMEQERSFYTLKPSRRRWNIKFPFRKRQFSTQHKENETMSKKDSRHNIIAASAYLSITTAIAALFFVTTENTASVAIIYALAAMLIARRTKSYVPGIITSCVSIVFIDFIFTYPFMELDFTLDGYPLTFIALIFITAMTNTLATHLKEQTRTLDEREHLLTEAEREEMRTNLLRAISHDLRTPLTSIIGTADNYLGYGDAMTEEEKAHLIHNISEDASWLLNMMENLLSVTRIQGEGADVVATLEPLEKVIPDAVIRFHKRLPNAAIQVNIPEDFIMVPMDATLIEQVIINLLENVVYHSNNNAPIELIVTMDKHFARFSIRDHGKGIDEAIVPTLSDGGAPASGQCNGSYKGMGVGLSICKTIVNAHHDDLFTRSHEDGTEFMFTLPIGEGHYEP